MDIPSPLASALRAEIREARVPNPIRNPLVPARTLEKLPFNLALGDFEVLSRVFLYLPSACCRSLI